MAIVVYRCDTCKRDVELIRNIRGLETPQRCVITHGCRGKLIQKDVLEDFSRASIPDEVDGLDDWIPRRILYNHTQTIQNSVWIITHNLGTFPAISVFADRPTLEDEKNREEITPEDVQILDKNTLLLRFDRPRSGIAQLIARSSDPQLFEPTSLVEEAVPTIQISSSSKVVLATRVKTGWSSDGANLRLDFTSNVGNVITLGYGAGSLSSSTAWSGVSKVVIRGKIYQLREFDSLATEMLNGTIINGTVFRFRDLDLDNNLTYETVVDSSDVTPGSPATTLLAPGDVYILLGASPFETVDKITDKAIDITAVTKSANARAMYYDTQELYASESVVQSIFPPIRPV